MSLYEATFKVKHECPYRTISDRHDSLTIREWFMHEQQILELSVVTSPTDELMEEINDLGTVLYETRNADSLYAVVQSSLCSLDDSLISRFEAHNCLYMPPTIYQHGWEHYTVTAFDDGNVQALLGDLDEEREIEVISTTPMSTRRVQHSQLVTTETLFDGLTPRQLDALCIAVDNGYFEQPRGASVGELAEQTSVARSTYEEHLRKAQNKVFRNTQNLLRLQAQQASDGDLRQRPEKQVLS